MTEGIGRHPDMSPRVLGFTGGAKKAEGSEGSDAPIIAARATGGSQEKKPGVIAARTPARKKDKRTGAGIQDEGVNVKSSKAARPGQAGSGGSESVARPRGNSDISGEQSTMQPGEPVQLAPPDDSSRSEGDLSVTDQARGRQKGVSRREKSHKEFLTRLWIGEEGQTIALREGEKTREYKTYKRGPQNREGGICLIDRARNIVTDEYDSFALIASGEADGTLIQGLTGELESKWYMLRPPTEDDPHFRRSDKGYDEIFYRDSKFYGRLGEQEEEIESSDTSDQKKNENGKELISIDASHIATARRVVEHAEREGIDVAPYVRELAERDPERPGVPAAYLGEGESGGKKTEQSVLEVDSVERDEAQAIKIGAAVTSVLRDVASRKHDRASEFDAWADQPFAVEALTSLAARYGKHLTGSVSDPEQGEKATSEDYRIVTEALEKMREEAGGETVGMDDAMNYIQNRHLVVLKDELSAIENRTAGRLTRVQDITAASTAAAGGIGADILISPHPSLVWLAATSIVGKVGYDLNRLASSRNANFENNKKAKIAEMKVQIVALEDQLGLAPSYDVDAIAAEAYPLVEHQWRSPRDVLKDLSIRVDPERALWMHRREQERYKHFTTVIQHSEQRGEDVPQITIENCIKAQRRMLSDEQVARAEAILAQRKDKQFRTDSRRRQDR